jgi:FkbM family methyltransferase
MIKKQINRLLGQAGFHVVNKGHLGIDVELDLARLTANDPIRTIFDVGANVGQSARRFVQAFPEAQIYSFEPVPSTFEVLAHSTRNLGRVKAFNLALGDAPGTATMNIHSDPLLNSIGFLPAAGGNTQVQVETVDRFADQHAVRDIDLLKIDVEGYELQVLGGATQRLSTGMIRYIYAECTMSPNPEAPHISFFDLHALLDNAEFCFVGYYADCFALKLGAATGNALYALRSRLPVQVQGPLRNIF